MNFMTLQDQIDKLSEKFAYYTECALATVGRFEGIETPSGELKRAKQIADDMVEVVQNLVDTANVNFRHHPRLLAELTRLRIKDEKISLWYMADGTSASLTDSQAAILRARKIFVTTDTPPFNTMPVRKISED